MYSYSAQVTHSDKAVFLELGGRRGSQQVAMLVYEALNVTGSVDLVHAEVDPLHALQVGWGHVRQHSEREAGNRPKFEASPSNFLKL